MQSDGDDTPQLPQRLERADGVSLAYHRVRRTRPQSGPGVVFMTGYLSDMSGGKALHLEAQCRARGRPFVRFDYRGHGLSSGRFADATIGDWRDDAVAVLDQLTEGPQVLVGSSMGGWIAVLAALARPDRVAGLATVAAAVDMTTDVIWPRLSGRDRAALRRDGRLEQPSPYGDRPFVLTWALMEEAERHRVLDGPIGLACPARLIHGSADPDVPWQQSLRLLERLAGDDVRLVLVKDGGHRLSEPRDLDLLAAAVDEICGDGAGTEQRPGPEAGLLVQQPPPAAPPEDQQDQQGGNGGDN